MEAASLPNSAFGVLLEKIDSWLWMGRSYHVLEAVVLATALYLCFTRAYNPLRLRQKRRKSAQSREDAERRVRTWRTAPLVEAEESDDGRGQPPELMLEGRAGGPRVLVGGERRRAEDFATTNFLGLVGDPAVGRACKETLVKYGCGACGPRGFYGTVDVHLECEEAIAKFCGTNDAILYSFGSAAPSSVVPAFLKRGDVVVCDQGVHFALVTGIKLSRAKVLWYKHNDMADLERVLASFAATTSPDESEKPITQCRFVIAEAISAYYGDIAPLDKIVELKNKYRYRLVLDESLSLGVLGATGRGALEEFGVERQDVEIATADLANATAAIGGYCVGEVGVVSHQRLSGAGYCFSASQPPFLAVAATVALKIIEEQGEDLTEALRRNINSFRDELDIENLDGWYVDGSARSPLMHLRCRKDKGLEVFREIQKRCVSEGILVAVPTYVQDEMFAPKPSIRVALSAKRSEDSVKRAARVIRTALLGAL